MALRFGQILRGARWNYQLVESLGNHNASSIVFKAEMLPGVESQLPGKWAAIKTTDKLDVLDMLKREHSYYMKPTIRSSRYIRTMYEEINGHSSPTTEIPYCLAFEWMDCTLKDVPPESRGHNSFLHKIVSKAVLNVLANLKSQQLVHGDIKNDNILISDLNGSSPVVKLGDLGLVRPEGFNEGFTQSLATRAPEIWSGLGCFHHSDVWAFAATLFDWIRPQIFGANDIPPCLYSWSWALGKLMRLFPDSVTIHPQPCYQAYFRNATLLEQSGYGDNTDPKCFETLTFEEELTKLDGPPELLEFLRYMLIVDYKRRPTALDVLKSQQFQLLGGTLASRL